MNKITCFVLLFVSTLICTNSFAKKKVEPINEPDKKVKPLKNEGCTDFKRFKVIQVLEDGHALVINCEDTSDMCYGIIALLLRQKSVDFYDGMMVKLPKEKCFIQNGVYRYETKNGIQKTVPVIDYGYAYYPTTPEEAMERFTEVLDYEEYDCKLWVADNDSTNTKDAKKCEVIRDCYFQFFQNALANKIDESTGTFDEQIVEKCGLFLQYSK